MPSYYKGIQIKEKKKNEMKEGGERKEGRGGKIGL